MIVDSLGNAGVYGAISPRLAAGFAFLRGADLARLPVGRTEVAAGVFALVQDYQSKPVEEGFFESHRRHIDIQYVVSGEERIGAAPVERLAVTQAFDEGKDLIKYAAGRFDWVTLRAGEFAVFFPQDGHMPGIRVEGAVAVRKVVVKVAV